MGIFFAKMKSFAFQTAGQRMKKYTFFVHGMMLNSTKKYKTQFQITVEGEEEIGKIDCLIRINSEGQIWELNDKNNEISISVNQNEIVKFQEAFWFVGERSINDKTYLTLQSGGNNDLWRLVRDF